MVSYGLPDLRPRCLMVAIPGMNRANGLIIGLKYLTWKFSTATGNTIGTPGALLGWSSLRDAADMPMNLAVPLRRERPPRLAPAQICTRACEIQPTTAVCAKLRRPLPVRNQFLFASSDQGQLS